LPIGRALICVNNSKKTAAEAAKTRRDIHVISAKDADHHTEFTQLPIPTTVYDAVSRYSSSKARHEY
jgi:hypothetical protein